VGRSGQTSAAPLLEFRDDLPRPPFPGAVLRALILAGGYGTRLAGVARGRSKVLLPVAGRPVIDYVIDIVSEVPEVGDAVVVTNQRFHTEFVEWAAARRGPLRMSVLNDGTTGPENRLGALGDVLFGIERAAIDDDLLIVAGDNLCDFRLSEMTAVLNDKGSCIALYDVGDVAAASKFNNVGFDDEGRITRFVEKPRNPTSSLVAVAIYMFRREDLPLFERFAREGNDLDLLGKFIEWAHRRVSIYAHTFRTNWWDIGDPEVYGAALQHFETARSADGVVS